MNILTICLFRYSAIHPQILPQEEQNSLNKDFTQWSGEENIPPQICFLDFFPVTQRNCRPLQTQTDLLWNTAVHTSRKENYTSDVSKLSTYTLLSDQERSFHRKRLVCVGGIFCFYRVGPSSLLPGRHCYCTVSQFFSPVCLLSQPSVPCWLFFFPRSPSP